MNKIYTYFLTIILLIMFIVSPLTAYATEANGELANTSDGDSAVEAPVPVNDAATKDGLWPMGPAIGSMSAVVMDYESGTILFDKAGAEAHFPASITKVMTALVALENCSLDEQVVFSRNAVYSLEPGSSSIARDEGEIMTMEECLYGLLLESANECANAIAEHVAGDIATFANMMNEKAKALGCENTHFTNANGLHDENHYTCARDMAKIARAAYENPTFEVIAGTKTYTIPPTNKHEEPTLLNNHHAMLNYYRTGKHLYEYCVGGKTGYTSNALSTLVTYAKKDDMTLIVVTMCVPGSGHYLDTRALYDFYFANMQSVRIGDISDSSSKFMGTSISKLVGTDEIPYSIDTDARIILPVGADTSAINMNYVSPDKGIKDAIGALSFTYGDKEVGKAAIIGKETEIYPFKNLAEEDEAGENDFIVINVIKIVLIILGVIVVLLVIGFLVIRTNTAVATARRRRIENRDPHKNMRRINRVRRRRRRRGR